MIFTLHQWLELAAIAVIPMVVVPLIGKFACSIEDRRNLRMSRQVGALLEQIRGMPD